MSGMTVLISPLSWGFGHAGRMIPLARELSQKGCDVIFAADTPLLQMAERELPGIRKVMIPGLSISYSRFLPQYISIFMQLPRIFASAVREHMVLKRLVKEFNPSVIISDNRFGFYHRDVFSVYVTHQIRIPFPGWLRFKEPVAAWLHRKIISRYDLCLVPDFPGSENLSGRLSHGLRLPGNVMYMGPLSRFAALDVKERSRPAASRNICLILSGPEPQRTIFLEKVAVALRGLLPSLSDNSAGAPLTDPMVDALPWKANWLRHAGGTPGLLNMTVLSATPLPGPVTASLASATFIIAPDTDTMRRIIISSSLVITRAGYTSVMELTALGKGAVLVPTPGQTEQEYIGEHLNGSYGFITVKQNELEQLAEIAGKEITSPSPAQSPSGTGQFPDHASLMEIAINILLEQDKQ